MWQECLFEMKQIRNQNIMKLLHWGILNLIRNCDKNFNNLKYKKSKIKNLKKRGKARLRLAIKQWKARSSQQAWQAGTSNRKH